MTTGMHPAKVTACWIFPIITVAVVLMAVWDDPNTGKWLWTAAVTGVASLPGLLVLMYNVSQNLPDE